MCAEMTVTGKRKRNVNGWKVFNEITNFGELRDENEQINVLPAVGTRVIVLEKHVFERSQGADGVIAEYRPSVSFHDPERISYRCIYRVIQYTKGIENIYDSRNLIVLKNERTGVTQSIKANSVATGSMKLRAVEEDYVERRDRSYDDVKFSSEVCEYSYKGTKNKEEEGSEE